MPEPNLPPLPKLPETKTRECPVCQSAAVAPAGSVVANGGKIKTQYRCETCKTDFWLVRIPMI